MTQKKAPAKKATKAPAKKATNRKPAQKPATGFTPKVKRSLVLPLLNRGMKPGDSLYVEITGEMYEGRPQKGAKANEKPATLAPATNLETGEIGEIIVSAVVESTLNDMFPNQGYIGHWFEIAKGEKKAGQRYFQYTINELEKS